MKRLGFLVGKWAGDARLLRGPTESVELVQTEEAQYKLDGLIVVIEGVGRTKSDSQPLLQAFGIISYDDESRTYCLRAFNDGRFLETQMKLLEEGKGMPCVDVIAKATCDDGCALDTGMEPELGGGTGLSSSPGWAR